MWYWAINGGAADAAGTAIPNTAAGRRATTDTTRRRYMESCSRRALMVGWTDDPHWAAAAVAAFHRKMVLRVRGDP
jgi:hypothetical protein